MHKRRHYFIVDLETECVHEYYTKWVQKDHLICVAISIHIPTNTTVVLPIPHRLAGLHS